MTGWDASPQIEIGYGNYYSKCVNDTKKRIIALDAHANTCIIQIIPKMPAGCFRITVNYAAFTGIDFASCSFIPYFNGVSLG